MASFGCLICRETLEIQSPEVDTTQNRLVWEKWHNSRKIWALEKTKVSFNAELYAEQEYLSIKFQTGQKIFSIFFTTPEKKSKKIFVHFGIFHLRILVQHGVLRWMTPWFFWELKFYASYAIFPKQVYFG